MRMVLQDSLLVINWGVGGGITEWFDFGQIFVCFREPDLTSGLDGNCDRSWVGNIFSDIFGFALRLTLAFYV